MQLMAMTAVSAVHRRSLLRKFRHTSQWARRTSLFDSHSRCVSFNSLHSV